MVSITNPPVLRGGSYVTSYKGTATIDPKDFVFSSVQETIFVKNNGVRMIEINGYRLQPNSSMRITENTDTVTVKSSFGSQPFGMDGVAVQSASVDTEARSEIASITSQLAQTVKGESGKKLKVVGCVLRNDGTGWKPIIDTGHNPVNVLSVSNDASDITVAFGFTAQKVVSFVATPDEAFVVNGYHFGASVGLSDAKIRISRQKTVGGYIYYNGTSWIASAPAMGITGITFNAGRLSFSHISIESAIGQVNCRDGVHIAQIGALGTTTSEIVIKDYAGNLVTTPDTNMRFYFSRHTDGKVDPNSVVDAGGNIWCYGIFEV